jgi:hypothetical protein
MAKRLTEVIPPTAIATGRIQVLNIPNAMIQTRQPDSVPVALGFIISPYKYRNNNIVIR